MLLYHLKQCRLNNIEGEKPLKPLGLSVASASISFSFYLHWAHKKWKMSSTEQSSFPVNEPRCILDILVRVYHGEMSVILADRHRCIKCTLSQQQRECHQRRDKRHGDLPKKGLSKYTFCQRVVAYSKTPINQKPL